VNQVSPQYAHRQSTIHVRPSVLVSTSIPTAPHLSHRIVSVAANFSTLSISGCYATPVIPGVLNSTAMSRTTVYSSNMTAELSPILIVDQRFEDRWAAWQARADANDLAAKRKLLFAAAILICSAAILNGLWLLQ
jgi:hypothetical protein